MSLFSDTDLSLTLFFSKIVSQSIDESVEELQKDAELRAIFKKAVENEPADAHIKTLMAQLAITHASPHPLPQWVTRLQLPPYTQEELISFVRSGRCEVIENIPRMEESYWVGIRDRQDSTLLHIALSLNNVPMALTLLQKCPQLFFQKNADGAYPLDLADPSRITSSQIEALVAHNPPESEEAPAAVAAFRRLASLCLLKSGHFALKYVAKNKSLLARVVPFQTANDPATLHPFKLCGELGKFELGQKLLGHFVWKKEALYEQLCWVAASGAREMIPYLFERLPPDTPCDTFNKAFYDEARLAPHMLFPEIVDRVPPNGFLLLLYLIHYDLQDEIPRWANRFLENDIVAYECILAAFDAPITSQYRTCQTNSQRESLVGNVVNLLNEFDGNTSEKGRKFIIGFVDELLASEAVISEECLRAIIQSLGHLRDADFAKRVLTSAVKNYYPPARLLDALISPDCPEVVLCLLSWLFESYPEMMQHALKTLKPSAVVTALLRYRTNKKSPLLEIARFLIAKGENLRSSITFDGAEITLRCIILLYGDRAWHALLPTHQLENEEIDQAIHCFIKSPFIATVEGLALFLPQCNLKLLSSDCIDKLIDTALTVVHRKDDLHVLEKLNTLFREQEGSVKECFSKRIALKDLRRLCSSAYDEAVRIALLDWLWAWGERAKTSSIGTLEWFPLPNKIRDVRVKKWAFTHISQGVSSVPRGKSGGTSGLASVLSDVARETFELTRSDGRFSVAHPDVYYKSQYCLKLNKKIFVQRAGTSIFSGYYTLDHLVQLLEKDRLEVQLGELQGFDFEREFGPRVLAQDCDITEYYFSSHIPNPQTVYIKNFPDSKCIYAYFCDPGSGKIESRVFSYKELDVLDSLRAFICDHEQALRQRKAALEAIEDCYVLWRNDPVLLSDKISIRVNISGKKTFFHLPHIRGHRAHDCFNLYSPGIPSQDVARMFIAELQGRQKRHQAFLDSSLRYSLTTPLQRFDTMAQLIDYSKTTLATTSRDLVAHDFFQESYLLVAQDARKSQLLLYPCRLGQMEQAALELRFLKKALSGLQLKWDTLKAIPMPNAARLVHEKKLPIDSNVLLALLEAAKDSPSVRRYLQDKKCTHAQLVSNLNTFFSKLTSRSIVGYTLDKIDAYARFEIQLSQTYHHLAKGEEKKEDLELFLCDLAYVGARCGAQISPVLQEHYNTAFGLFENNELQALGIEGVLQEGYRRATLQVLNTLVGFALDPEAREETYHVLNHLRKTLVSKGIPLPPDMRETVKEDEFSSQLGKKDYPREKLFEIFDGMLMAQLIRSLQEIQSEKSVDVKRLLVDSVKECMLQCPDIQPLLRAQEEEMSKMRKASQLDPESRKRYQAIVQPRTLLDAKIKTTIHQRLSSHRQEQALLQPYALVQKGRLEHVQNDHQRLTLELASLRALEAKLTDALSTILIKPSVKDIEECASRHSQNITKELERLALEQKLLAMEDETDIVYVTQEGILALLQKFSYYTPANLLF